MRRVRPLVGLTVASLAGFIALTQWTRKLPTLRGSAGSLKDVLVRGGAILVGVVFVVCLVGSIIPLVLDRLEAGRFSSFVAARHELRSSPSRSLSAIFRTQSS